MFPGLKRQLHVFAPLIAGLTVITLLTALGGLWQYQHEINHQASANGLTGTAEAAAVQKEAAATGSSAVVQSNVHGQSKASTPSAKGSSTSGQAAPGGSAPSASAPSNKPAASAPASVAVGLSVNGQAKGTVRLAAGGTQCDVLSQALSQGLIHSLDMRYSSQYNTEGVYVIDGLGDPGTVWWTYKVNGYPPPYGCAYVTAHDGDSVNWQYVKS